MKLKMVKPIGVVISILLLGGNSYAQELQTSLFIEVDKMIYLAKQEQADVLSPKTFDEGMAAYLEAQKDYRDEKSLSDIKKNIKTADKKFSESIENSRISSVMFSNVMSARKDAISAEAARFNKETWNEAEEEMKDAATEMEKGDADDAKDKAKAAAVLYRKAELESIKANYLNNAKKLVKQAEANKVDKAAPKTLDEARELIKKAEKELAENRYDTDGARYMAKEAEYKVLLSMQIASQKNVFDEKKFKTEDFLLNTYAPIARIGEHLDMEMRFDKGIDGPVLDILARMNRDKLQISNLEAGLYNATKQNEHLSDMLAEQRKILAIMKVELSDEAMLAQKRQEVLQNRINRVAEIDTKFDEIQQIFTTAEAQVFRQKDDVIIRLIGLNFDVSKSQIREGDYALLTKVKKAIGTFTNADFIIEGHTDSHGGDDQNLELSQERANAVLSYLNANTAVDQSKFSTTGFGESKPVANNETAAGRTQNRRIDIVIRPSYLDTSVYVN